MGLDPSNGERGSSALGPGVPCWLIAGLGTGFLVIGDRMCSLAGEVLTGDGFMGEEMGATEDWGCRTGDEEAGAGVPAWLGVAV
jgi:hypothetical protein